MHMHLWGRYRRESASYLAIDFRLNIRYYSQLLGTPQRRHLDSAVISLRWGAEA